MLVPYHVNPACHAPRVTRRSTGRDRLPRYVIISGTSEVPFCRVFVESSAGERRGIAGKPLIILGKKLGMEEPRQRGSTGSNLLILDRNLLEAGSGIEPLYED